LWLHWHTGEPAPIEWLKVIFYREFGWTPAELRAVPLSDIQAILTVLTEEVKYQKRPKAKPVNTA
jgi:hypothetical protein